MTNYITYYNSRTASLLECFNKQLGCHTYRRKEQDAQHNTFVGQHQQHRSPESSQTCGHMLRLISLSRWCGFVIDLSRVGGSSVRDFVNKVTNQIMSNTLMVKFNMRGDGQLEKKPFKATPFILCNSR